jgi:phosphoribosylformylglycinamidine synthase
VVGLIPDKHLRGCFVVCHYLQLNKESAAMVTKLFRRLPGQPGLEECYYVECSRTLTEHEMAIVRWLVCEQDGEISTESHYSGNVKEVGPRLSVETPFSSNVTSIFARLGVPVTRIERSLRALTHSTTESLPVDPLTQQVYLEPLTDFGFGQVPEPVRIIPFLADGVDALRAINLGLGLGMDDWDIEYVAKMYSDLNRDPTDVELIQLGNGNSEHSRHHFFRGIHVIDGAEMPESLMDIVKKPWKSTDNNSLVAFHDNSGVIKGARTQLFAPLRPGSPSPLVRRDVLQHITATAETHNHPTMIAPFPGAETGAGGRIRDNRAVGRGGLTHAGLAGYCVGNLHIEGHAIPGEVLGGENTGQHATPLQILIQGSNGVSDYGNKVGEPLLGGFTRSFGLMVDDLRREFRKPVLYTAGLRAHRRPACEQTTS